MQRSCLHCNVWVSDLPSSCVVTFLPMCWDKCEGTFALSNSISAHTFKLVFVAYDLGTVAFHSDLTYLPCENYIRIVSFMPLCLYPHHNPTRFSPPR
jgi:hypothetical protein